MSKISLVKIMEDVDPNEPQFKQFKAEYSTVLKPIGASVEDVVAALNNVDNYGKFATSSMRNTAINKAEINKAIDDHFGPSIPSRKKALEKQRSEPFPPKSKDALNAFMEKFKSKPKMLSWVIKDDTLVFPHNKNPKREAIKEVLGVVLGNAGIEFSTSEKEEI